LNNRSVTTSRWNKPLLLQKAAPASDTDITPVNAFVAPDWTLVSRDGSNPTIWDSNMRYSASDATTVIGRYAYAIYDEGGLLDMNVAGYPTVLATAQVGRKGPAAFADLTQVPGVSPTPPITPALTVSNQNKLRNDIVGWRNYASAAATGRYTNFSTSSNPYTFASGAPYFTAILSNTTGFLKTANTALNNNQSDRMFTSRQQLINLLVRSTASGGTGSTSVAERANLQAALEYLGTFSRELNRPSWKPALNATDMGAANNGPGNIYAYKDNAENSTAINRNLSTVRVTASFVRADGTTANVGEQLLKSRFPLTRLSTLTPASTTALRDFGLTWDTGNNRWTYAHGNSTHILRMDEIAAAAREPDFFELLKAVILNGSVGLGSGPSGTFVAAEPKYYDNAGGVSADFQIIQIGANIIDAWDGDNIPTFIYFNGNELAGVENLPYLNKLVLSFLFTNQGHDDLFYSWFVPSLWNPHQNGGDATKITNDVRFAMTSGSVTSNVLNTGTLGTFVSSPIPNAGPYPYIQLKANSFKTPCPPVPTPAVSPLPNNESGTPSKVGQVSATNQGKGYYDGLDFGSYSDTSGTGKNSWKNVASVYPIFSAGTNFELQININGTWKAYQSWRGCNNGTQAAPLVVCQGAKKGRWKDSIGFKDPEFVALDPRTVRFGIWASDGNSTANDTDYDIGAEDTMDENPTGLELVSALKPQPASSFPTTGKTYFYSSNDPNNSASNGNRYADLDGVTRRADWTTDVNGTTAKKTVMYASASPSPIPSPTPNNSQDRPQNLSSFFQSVAELGQVFRDQPWKTLSFSMTNSADSGLLDVFTLQDVPMVAGKTDLNTKQPPVLTAILAQATKNLNGGQAVGSTSPNNGPTLVPGDISQIITRLIGLTTTDAGAQAMANKAELVTRLMEDASLNANVWTKLATNPYNKETRESVIRAFCDATQTRTWNLMIDLIAQSGRYPATATDVSQFIVEGEKRYWLHVAIDRFTGDVIDQQLEPVYE
jgi:hypothetical protein